MDQETQAATGAEAQNAAPETDETPEVVTPDADAEQQQEDAKPEEDEGRRAIQRMQRRIDKRTADLYRERAEAQQLRERLRQYEQSQQQEEPQQYAPDPLTLAKEISKIERVTERANTVAKDGEKRFTDFRQAVTAVVQEIGPLFDQIGRPTPISEAILDSDDAAGLLHYLGTNPDAAADLEGLTPAQLGRRIALIEARMKDAARPKQSAAPKPVSPTRAGGRDDGGLRDDLPIEEWNRRYQKLMRGG